MTDVAPFDAGSIDPAKDYDVVLAKPVTIHGTELRPRDDHWMVGSFLQQLVQQAGADVVYRATARS